jgi:hypothetical protein
MKGMLSFCPEDGRNRVALIQRNKLEEQMQQQRLKENNGKPYSINADFIKLSVILKCNRKSYD